MTIREYIQQNPAASDADVIAALNGESYAPVPLSSIEVWTVVGTRRARMRAASVNEAFPIELRAGLLDLFDALASPRLDNLDLADVAIRERWLAGAAGLAMAGVLSEEEAGELQAFGRTVVAHIEADVQAARRQMAIDVLRQRVAADYNAKVAAIDAGETDLEVVRAIVVN
jgi:hypothetical protein